MSALIINGKSLAAAKLTRLGKKIDDLKSRHNRGVHLAVILVGEDTPSRLYVANKLRTCERVRIKASLHSLTAAAAQEDLLRLIHQLNRDERIHGIIVQLPLPPTMNTAGILSAVHPGKDVDGLHPDNQAALYLKRKTGLVPCTPLGCLHLIRQVHPEPAGLHVAIVGRSRLVGSPLSLLLLQWNCSVSILHSQSSQPQRISAQADIVVGAAGVPELITAEWIKEGATLIDVGIHHIKDKGKVRLCGDIAYGQVVDKAKAITPVPGGVGPMTVACLMENCYQAATRDL